MALGERQRVGYAAVAFMLATLALGCFNEVGPPPGWNPPTVVCGDGICSAGETCASYPDDCAADCQSSCGATDLLVAISAHVDGSTWSAPSGVDVASCGDGGSNPTQSYRFTADAPGLYHVSASGTFALVLDARLQTCGGAEVACQTAGRGDIAAFDVSLATGQQILVEVAGLGGGSGTFRLDITLEPLCGNQVCDFGETCSSCPSDCGSCRPPVICGDGVCDVGEGCASCEADCGPCATSVCGDGICEISESCGSCPADCGTCGSSCGDGICADGENCATCPSDCGTCGSSCGDGICGAGEDCATCPSDCGTCGAFCGDGICQEDCASCPSDCGICPDP